MLKFRFSLQRGRKQRVVLTCTHIRMTRIIPSMKDDDTIMSTDLWGPRLWNKTTVVSYCPTEIGLFWEMGGGGLPSPSCLTVSVALFCPFSNSLEVKDTVTKTTGLKRFQRVLWRLLKFNRVNTNKANGTKNHLCVVPLWIHTWTLTYRAFYSLRFTKVFLWFSERILFLLPGHRFISLA